MYFNKIKLNNIKLKPIFVAPMAAISDAAFRLLCLENNFDLAFTEMISANALVRKNKATLNLLQKTPEEKYFAPQIFGQNTKNLVKAAKILEKEFNADIIDINFGCPARKIMQQGAGSALLKRPEKIKEIVSEVKKNISIPLSCKIRTGITKNKINAINISKIIQEAGADMLTVHARTQSQGYSGTADWNIIKQIKDIIKIPLIANGDISTIEDIKKIKEETNCDGVMIGRAAKNNPFLLTNKKINTFKKYISIVEKYNLNIKFIHIKMHLMSFSKGVNAGPKMRNKIMKATTIEELKELSYTEEF